MVALTRNRRPNESYATSLATGSAPSATVRHDTEAPERAASTCEAPESRRTRRAEAPDAGEGRNSCHEAEFTHGRSQS